MKKNLQNQIDALKKQIEKSNEYIDRSRVELERLEEELRDIDKTKPMIYLNNNAPSYFNPTDLSYEITKYIKYSDEFIEFKANGFVFRYIKSYNSRLYRFPPKCNVNTIYDISSHSFEIYDFARKEYIPVDYINYITLIPGVNEYD